MARITVDLKNNTSAGLKKIREDLEALTKISTNNKGFSIGVNQSDETRLGRIKELLTDISKISLTKVGLAAFNRQITKLGQANVSKIGELAGILDRLGKTTVSGSGVSAVSDQVQKATNAVNRATASTKAFSDENKKANTNVTAFGRTLFGVSAGYFALSRSVRAVRDISRAYIDAIVDQSDALKVLENVLRPTAEQTAELATQQRDLAASTRFDPGQIVEGQIALARAGRDAGEIISSLPAITNFATVGLLDLGEASDTVTKILAASGSSFENAEILIDKLAKTAENAPTSIAEIARGLQEVAPLTTAYNITLEEFNAALAVLATNGARGARGGKILVQSLARLTKPTRDGAKALESMNIAVNDISPATNSLSSILSTLKEGLDGLEETQGPEAVAQALNNLVQRRYVPQFQALLNSLEGMDDGTERASKSLGEFLKLQESSGGVARRQAENLESGLGGALRRTDAAIQNLFRSSSDFADTNFAPVVDQFNNLVNILNDADAAKLTEIDLSNTNEAVSETAKLVGDLGQLFGITAGQADNSSGVISQAIAVIVLAARSVTQVFTAVSEVITSAASLIGINIGAITENFPLLLETIGNSFDKAINSIILGLRILRVRVVSTINDIVESIPLLDITADRSGEREARTRVQEQRQVLADLDKVSKDIEERRKTNIAIFDAAVDDAVNDFNEAILRIGNATQTQNQIANSQERGDSTTRTGAIQGDTAINKRIRDQIKTTEEAITKLRDEQKNQSDLGLLTDEKRLEILKQEAALEETLLRLRSNQAETETRRASAAEFAINNDTSRDDAEGITQLREAAQKRAEAAKAEEDKLKEELKEIRAANAQEIAVLEAKVTADADKKKATDRRQREDEAAKQLVEDAKQQQKELNDAIDEAQRDLRNSVDNNREALSRNDITKDQFNSERIADINDYISALSRVRGELASIPDSTKEALGGVEAFNNGINIDRAEEGIQRLTNEIRGMTSQIRDEMEPAVNSAFSDLFENIITGSKSATEAILDFTNSIASALAQRASQRISDQLTDELFDGIDSLFLGDRDETSTLAEAARQEEDDSTGQLIAGIDGLLSAVGVTNGATGLGEDADGVDVVSKLEEIRELLAAGNNQNRLTRTPVASSSAGVGGRLVSVLGSEISKGFEDAGDEPAPDPEPTPNAASSDDETAEAIGKSIDVSLKKTGDDIVSGLASAGESIGDSVDGASNTSQTTTAVSEKSDEKPAERPAEESDSGEDESNDDKVAGAVAGLAAALPAIINNITTSSREDFIPENGLRTADSTTLSDEVLTKASDGSFIRVKVENAEQFNASGQRFSDGGANERDINARVGGSVSSAVGAISPELGGIFSGLTSIVDTSLAKINEPEAAKTSILDNENQDIDQIKIVNALEQAQLSIGNTDFLTQDGTNISENLQSINSNDILTNEEERKKDENIAVSIHDNRETSEQFLKSTRGRGVLLETMSSNRSRVRSVLDVGKKK